VGVRTAQGNLQMQFQVNLREVGLDKSEEARASHEELLRLAVAQPRPMHLPPHSGLGTREEGKALAGNPTEHLLLIVPVMLNEQVSGLIEVWQGANRPASAVPGFLNFMGLMADLCTRYQRNQMLGQMVGQQQLWTQLEGFSRLIHASLNTIEVAYQVANEGRRLIDCDRVSVAVKRARKTRIEAVSGADVVERRSNLVRLMRALCDAVLDWGEKLVFTGTRDEGLPPKVIESLDAYLAESPSKLLVVQPLRDEREKDDKGKVIKPPRTALLMECFEPPPDPQQLIARLEVVGRHAASALYNAVEHQRIPFRWVWQPIAKVQEGLGGKARAITATVIILVGLLAGAMYFIPYPLKMSADGKLEPRVRRTIYAPFEGTVDRFFVKENDVVGERRDLGRMYALELRNKVATLEAEIRQAGIEADEYENAATKSEIPATEKASLRTNAAQKRATQVNKRRELEDLISRTAALRDRAGFFTLQAPRFTPQEAALLQQREWTVLGSGTEKPFKELWEGKQARPSDPILRLGAKDGPWEIELKIPQKHIGQILHAFERLDVHELDVDFLLKTDPTRVFKGKLARNRLAAEANAARDEKDEAEPVMLAFVRITGADIPPDDRLPRDLRLSGTEVNAKVRCGDARMGYSLFYGVWEFLYEKVVFFF
jgi:multidrug efflux pump subunit AcrA (membrane-fusion protein)